MPLRSPRLHGKRPRCPEATSFGKHDASEQHSSLASCRQSLGRRLSEFVSFCQCHRRSRVRRCRHIVVGLKTQSLRIAFYSDVPRLSPPACRAAQTRRPQRRVAVGRNIVRRYDGSQLVINSASTPANGRRIRVRKWARRFARSPIERLSVYLMQQPRLPRFFIGH